MPRKTKKAQEEEVMEETKQETSVVVTPPPPFKVPEPPPLLSQPFVPQIKFGDHVAFIVTGRVVSVGNDGKEITIIPDTQQAQYTRSVKDVRLSR